MPRATCSTSARPRTSRSGSRPTRGRPAHDTRIDAHDRGDRVAGVRHHRDRDRGAAARSQPDQAAAAALQRAAARRQVVSLHPHHRRITGRRRSSSIAARARARAAITGRSPRSGRSTAPSPRCSARSCCAPARTGFSRAARGRACCIRSSAARRPAPRRSISPAISELVREANAFLSGKSQAVQQRTGRRDGEGRRRARFRARRDLPRPPRRAVGDRSRTRASIRAASRRPTCSPSIRTAASAASRCSSSAPGRTGATAPIFPRPTARSAPGEVLGAFLAQFYDDKPPPRCVLLSHDIPGARVAGGSALHQEPAARSRSACRSAARSKELVAHALANAREALGRKLADTSSQQKLLKGAGRDVRSAAPAAPHRGLRQQPYPGLATRSAP